MATSTRKDFNSSTRGSYVDEADGTTSQQVRVLGGLSSVVGFTNPTGLDRLKKQMAKAGKNSAGTGLGGVDIAFVGDSLLESMVVTSYRDDGIVPQVRNLLQNRFNPYGVIGGEGFVPVRSGNNNTNNLWGGLITNTDGLSGVAANNMVWTPSGTAIHNNPTSAGNNGPIARKLTEFTGATNQIRVFFDKNFSLVRRRLLTSLDVVYGQSDGTGSTLTGGTFTWDISNTDAFITAGTGGVGFTGTINSNGASSFGKRSVGLGGVLSNTNSYCFQISGPASGTAEIDGVIAYNGDESCGVRTHNFARVGASTADNYNEVTKVATFDVPQSRAGSPAGSNATNAYLYIMNLITNDCNAQYTIANFTTNYGTLIDRAIAGGSCVILMIPPLYDTALLTKTIPWQSYVDAIYALQAARPTTTAVLDFWKWSGNPTTTTEMITTMGWEDATSKHHTDTGARGIAQVIYDAILAGVS